MSIKYVEYLEADGNSYFELPAGTITWNSNSGIEVQYYHNAYVGKSYLIGAYGLNGNTSIYTYYEQLGIFMFEQKFIKNWDTNGYKANIQPYIHTIKIDKSGRTFDGVTESITWSEPENWIFERINVSPVRIFGQGSNQGDNYKYVALQGTRIYYVKIYNGDEVVHYFRPCLKGNTPCIYDEISQTFYYNQGTGTFGYGKALNTLHLFANNNQGTAENLGNYRLYNMKIEGDSEGVESGINYVDCLIGDGNSYIDTGIVVRNGYTIDLTFASTIDRYNQEPICGSGDVVGYTYDRFGGYGIGLKSYFVAVREIRDEASIDKNELETTTVTFAIDEKVNFSHKFTNVNNNGSCLVMGQNYCNNSNPASPDYKTSNTVKLYDFKIYDDNDTLLIHLRPCLDTEGIPCMYDEVSKQYFHNQGSGTFGYKKELRDFQPVLDSNGVPCLMDKINKKYYYDKNGKGFGCEESYKPVSYLQGDGNSWIDTGILGNLQYKYEMIVEDNTTDNYENFFGSHIGANDLCICRRIEGKEINFSYNGTIFAGFALPTSKSTIYIDKNKLYINNSLVQTATETTQTTCHNTISIYTIRNGSTINSMSNIKVYSFKMWNENSELILDLIPVLDKNNTPCMYDKVSKQFFYNQGSGEFGYGIEESECPKVTNAIDYIKKISRNNSDYFRTKNFNGLINENLIIKTKIALGSVRDNNGVYFQIVGQYNTNRLYLGYKTANNSLEYTFFGAHDSVTLTDYDVFNDEVWEIELSKNGLTVNGVFIKSLESDITGTSLVVPLYIFQTVTYQDKANGNILPGQKIYELIFEQDGQIIANFQPCLDDNGNICFCDIVDNTYYYPTLGTSYEYNQLLQTPIKYIETNGTQYIDTGVVPTDNTDIDMVARACESKTIALDYCYTGDGHYYTPKFPCNEVNNAITNNSDHSIVADFYGDDGAWKWQGEIKSGTTENLSQHSYVAVRFTAKDQINYVNDYIFIQGEQSYSSKPGDTDLVISLQDCMSIGYLMNDLIIGGTYKFKETNTTVEPNLTASEGATLTLGSTYMSYLSEEELEQATKNGWIIE